MNAVLIPSLLALSVSALAAEAPCPLFGTLEPQQNADCLVEEYQHYAEAWSPPELVPVVLTPESAALARQVFGGKSARIESKCLMFLAAPFSFDELWAVQDDCRAALEAQQ